VVTPHKYHIYVLWDDHRTSLFSDGFSGLKKRPARKNEKSKKDECPQNFRNSDSILGELMTPLAWATASSRTKIDLLLQAAAVR
jgi:hypothetical protein